MVLRGRGVPRFSREEGPDEGRMLKAREAASAEQERLRLMIPRRRSTTRTEEGIAPCAMDGEEPGTEEGHELVIAGGAERRCGVIERGRSVRKRRK